MSAHLCQSIKYIVEEEKDLSLGHLGNIVHTLAGIVSNSGVLIRETSEHRRYDLFQIGRHSFLDFSTSVSGATARPILLVLTHRTQGDRGSRQSDQTTIPGMGLVYGISVIVAELFHNP